MKAKISKVGWRCMLWYSMAALRMGMLETTPLVLEVEKEVEGGISISPRRPDEVLVRQVGSGLLRDQCCRHS